MILSVQKIKILQLISNQFRRKENCLVWSLSHSKNTVYCHYLEYVSTSTVFTLSWNRPETEKRNWLYQTILCMPGLVNAKLKVTLICIFDILCVSKRDVIIIGEKIGNFDIPQAPIPLVAKLPDWKKQQDNTTYF